MEPDTEQGDTEYNLRLSRLRLSFKIKTRHQQQQQQAPDMPSRGEAAVHPAYRHAVASPTHQVNILCNTYNIKTHFVYLKAVR